MLGGSSQQITAIETAKRLGLYTILCDYLPDNPGQYHADKFYQISTTDKETVLKIAIDEHVNYVIAYASDPAAPTAAYVAEKLGLPTNPYKSVEILCSKDKFREFLSTHGFHAPRAAGYVRKKDALQDIGSFQMPIIIKPADSSGSKGVSVLKNTEELDKAIDFAFSFSHGHRIVIEEFIEKKHPYLIGGDIFVSEGKVILWGLLNCYRDSRVNPLVPVGKSFPLLIEEKGLQAVKNVLQKLVTDLGIKFGPMNVELIIDKYGRVFPIDIGPRSGGNMIPDLLGMVFHCDVVELAIRAAMGEKVSGSFDHVKKYYATYNLHSDRDGIFQDVEFRGDLRKYLVRKNIYKKPGDRVCFFSNAADVIGIIFMKFETETEMTDIMETINKKVRIILAGGVICHNIVTAVSDRRRAA